MKPSEGNFQLGWEEQGAGPGSGLRDSLEDSAPLYLDRLHSLAEAEKLFDELTQEKLQVRRAHYQLVTSHAAFVSTQTVLINSAQEVY